MAGRQGKGLLQGHARARLQGMHHLPLLQAHTSYTLFRQHGINIDFPVIVVYSLADNMNGVGFQSSDASNSQDRSVAFRAASSPLHHLLMALTDDDKGMVRQKTVDVKTECPCYHTRGRMAGGRGRGFWCGTCLNIRMGQNLDEVLLRIYSSTKEKICYYSCITTILLLFHISQYRCSFVTSGGTS